MLSFNMNGQVFFVLHMNSKFQIPIYNNASYDNSNFDNEKIHFYTNRFNDTYFKNSPKIMDYENII